MNRPCQKAGYVNSHNHYLQLSWEKKIFKIFSSIPNLYLLILTIICLIGFCPTTAKAGKKSIWKTVQQAQEYENSGNLGQALPLWLEIIDYFEQGTDESSYTNAALFHKKAGKYYDSIKDYENAVYHYEKENEFWLKIGKDWGTEDMIRADQIRSFFEMYIETKPVMTREPAKYEPVAGFYNGIYCEHDSNIGQDLYKTGMAYGHHSIFLFYEEWGNIYTFDYGVTSPFDLKMSQRIKNEGAAFQQAMNSSIGGLDAINENQWIIQWAQAARTSGLPIFLRFLPEMNGDWTAWSGNPEVYKEKFRLIHDIMAQYAPNVAMVWSPNDVPVSLNGHRIEDYYPGDDYVDWVGVNFYVDYYQNGDVTLPDNRLQNPLDHLKYIYNMFHERKPIMVCETGVSHYSITAQQDLTDWAVANLEKLYTMLPVVYPDVKAISYFSMDQGSPFYNNPNTVWNNYRLSDNQKMAAKYVELMKSPSIVHDIGGSSGFTYRKIDASELPLYSKVIFNIKIPDYKIQRVEFVVDDILVKTDYGLPFSLEYDLAFAGKIKIRVFDSQGNIAAEREITVPGTDPALNGAYSNGFSTGMAFCSNAIESCDMAQHLSVPDMPPDQCSHLDTETGKLSIPCLWIGNRLLNATLGTYSKIENNVIDIQDFTIDTIKPMEAGPMAWFRGYEKGVGTCLENTKYCPQDIIEHAFDNICAEYQASTASIFIPCTHVDGPSNTLSTRVSLSQEDESALLSTAGLQQ